MRRDVSLLTTVLLLLVLVSSVQALDIKPAPSGESSLWVIVSDWLGTSVTESQLEAAPVVETLPRGIYTTLHRARYAGYNQTFG